MSKLAPTTISGGATVPPITTGQSVVTTSTEEQVQPSSFLQFEDSINKWTEELIEEEKTFLNQAEQINLWDAKVTENSLKLEALSELIKAVTEQQRQINLDIDFMTVQQRDLESCLAALESESNQLVSVASEPQRNSLYLLAEKVDCSLKRMSEDLKELIEHINETDHSPDTKDPVKQIGKVLNTHMVSLNWVDENIGLIKESYEKLALQFEKRNEEEDDEMKKKKQNN